MNVFRKVCLVSAVLAVAGLAQAAPITAFTQTSRDTTAGLAGWTAGWGFHVNSAITVSALGFETGTGGAGNVGLVSTVAHPVTIYKLSDQSVVATGTVAAGTAVDAQGFGWVTITDTPLAAGGDYVISAYLPPGNTDSFAQRGQGTFSPELTWTAPRYRNNQDGFPTTISDDSLSGPPVQYEYIAANFQYSVPEPASLGLLATGGLLALRRRRAV